MLAWIIRTGIIDFSRKTTNVCVITMHFEALLRECLTNRIVCYRYHSKSSGLRFNKFVFGPVVMRMYWHLGLAVKALQVSTGWCGCIGTCGWPLGHGLVHRKRDCRVVQLNSSTVGTTLHVRPTCWDSILTATFLGFHGA